jgi:hypothetical protein
MQGKAQFSGSNRRIMEADAPPRRVYQTWKGSNVRDSCSLPRFFYSAILVQDNEFRNSYHGFCRPGSFHRDMGW